MRKQVNRYNLVNSETNKVFKSGMTASEISKKYKMPRCNVYIYVKNGYLINKKLLIVPSAENKDIKQSIYAEWDKTRQLVNPEVKV